MEENEREDTLYPYIFLSRFLYTYRDAKIKKK